jgi:hypothetical protein
LTLQHSPHATYKKPGFRQKPGFWHLACGAGCMPVRRVEFSRMPRDENPYKAPQSQQEEQRSVGPRWYVLVFWVCLMLSWMALLLVVLFALFG